MDDFRFTTREEYEQELKKLVLVLKKKRSKLEEQQYEDLMEEYLRFCQIDHE